MYKRNGIWYISVGGVRQSARTTIREDAKLLEHKLNKEAWDRRTGLSIPTWDQACLSWIDDNPGLAGKYINLKYSKWWKPWLTGKRLDSITPKLIHKIIAEALEPTGEDQFGLVGFRPKFPVNVNDPAPANSTANGYVGFVGRVIRHGSNLNPKLTYYPKPRGRDRWLTVAEWAQLCAVMSNDLRDISTFALATLLREANDMFFRWAWLQGGDTWALIPSELTKTRKPYGVPLNKTAQSVIRRRREAAVRHPEFVFLRGGGLWNRVSICRELDASVARAAIPKITFHGFRHTGASWLAQKGASEPIIARLGCWSPPRGEHNHYSHFDYESLRPYSELIDEILAGSMAGSPNYVRQA